MGDALYTGMDEAADQLRARGVTEGEVEAAKKDLEAVQGHMSPPGALNLPEKLDRRRLEHAIPDEAFSVQAVYNRILVHQTSQHKSENYGDSQIIMPQWVQEREEREAPRGIIVSAGLEAQDILRSSGMELGEWIYFIHDAPWRTRYAIINQRPRHLLIMQVGDILGSEDVAAQLREGTARVEFYSDNRQHELAYADGTSVEPKMPKIPEDR